MILSSFFVFLIFNLQAQDLSSSEYEQGAYLTRLAGCAECHSQSLDGPLVGGYPLATPFGTFYTQNITPDPETGIGNWSAQDFHNALRNGRTPDGSYLYPSFPFRSYSKMTDEDIHKIYVYLMAQKPVHHKNKRHDIPFYLRIRRFNEVWQNLFFLERSDPYTNIKVGPGPFSPIPTKSSSWNRGAYLVESMLHCAECHSPRNSFGAPDESQWMAGSDLGGKPVPNITPGKGALSGWTRDTWQSFLTSGVTPEGTSVGGDMALVLKNASAMTTQDRDAVIEYLMSLEPIDEESAP